MVSDLEFSPNGSLLAIPTKGEPGKTLHLLDLQTGKLRRELSGPTTNW